MAKRSPQWDPHRRAPRTPRPQSSSRSRRRTPGRREWRRTACGRLAVHDGPELGGIRLRIVGGELSGFVDEVAHLRIDLLQIVFARELPLQHTYSHLLDRIVLG